MGTEPIKIKKEKSNGSSAENQKGIENHKAAAKHLEEAAKYHRAAAKHHEAGDHGKAAKSTIAAIGHRNLAGEAEKEDSKHHALKS